MVISNPRMTSLLRKFRINFSAVIEVQGVSNKPSPERYTVRACVPCRNCGLTLCAPFSIDKYRQLPLHEAGGMDTKELDKIVSLVL